MAAAHHEIDEDAPAEADVVVCGGGPGGSTFATLMARRGYRTVLFERERFPRFHIGESLLPWNVPLFERIEVLSKLETAGPQVKLGARFYHQGSDFTRLVMFANGIDRSAAFAHYDTFRRVEGPTGGDIVVVTTPDGWWWLIPFSDGSVSVGIVMPSRRFKERSGSVEQLFEESVAGTPEVRDLLSGSKRTMDVHAIADYSYSTPRISGDGFCLVGDAACFLDPVFSSGVLLAMESAELAASSVDRALRSKGRVDAADFRDFEKIYRRAVDGVAPMLFAASGIRRLAHEVKGAGDGAAATTLEEPREADKLTRSVVLEGIDVKHEKVARARSG